MGKRGIIAGITLTAAAIGGGSANMVRRYNAEGHTDKANAAIAAAYLANKDTVVQQVKDRVAEEDRKLTDYTKQFGANCMLLIMKEGLDTPAKIQSANTCELEPDRIKDARDLVDDVANEKTELLTYVQKSEYGYPSLLDQYADNARAVVKDASDLSVVNDFLDSLPSDAISAHVNEDGSISTESARGDEYDGAVAYGYLLLAIPGLATLGIGLEGRKTKNSPLPNNSEAVATA